MLKFAISLAGLLNDNTNAMAALAELRKLNTTKADAAEIEYRANSKLSAEEKKQEAKQLAEMVRAMEFE